MAKRKYNLGAPQNERRSGIYAIINNINGKRYIGTACGFHHRWTNHIRALNRHDHSNARLQADWTKYGQCVFTFEILEVVTHNYEYETWSRETYWIKHYAEQGVELYNYQRGGLSRKAIKDLFDNPTGEA